MQKDVVKLSKFSLLADKLCPLDMAQKRGNGWFLKKELFPTKDGTLIYKKHPGYFIYEGVAYPNGDAIKLISCTGEVTLPKDRVPKDTVKDAKGNLYDSKTTALARGLAVIQHKGEEIALDATPNKAYHSGERTKLQSKSNYFIGFEVEKEDATLYLEPAEKVGLLTGWTKERDGSLNGNGFELISPAYGFPSRKLATDLSNTYLQQLLNAGSSSRCGGHINLSCTECTPLQLAQSMRAYMPLLYSLFSDRTDNPYCAAMSMDQLIRGGRGALHVKPYAIEFRIFPAVRSVTDLKNRIALINYFIRNRDLSYQDVFKRIDGELATLCNAVKGITPDALKKAYADNCFEYEGVSCV